MRVKYIMMLNRCDCCHGKKTVVALGNIKKTCAKCAGVGYVKIETKVADDVKVKRARARFVEVVEKVEE